MLFFYPKRQRTLEKLIKIKQYILTKKLPKLRKLEDQRRIVKYIELIMYIDYVELINMFYRL